MEVRYWTWIFVGLSFSLYMGIAWVSRVRDTKGFYVAGGGVPSVANGMATAADWMSAASFISMAGLISTMGYAGGVYLMGWTGGFVLLALMIAPYLRKFGHFTVPDFVGDRYSSDFARLVAIFCALFVSFTYVAGQMRGVGIVFSRFLEMDVNTGVVVGMIIVSVYAILGGMKGITWTQVAQYWVLITAFLTPVIAISFKLTGNVVPQVGMGAELLPEIAGGSSVYMLDKLNLVLQDFGFDSYTDTFVGQWDKVNVFFVALALMAGTAGLPHVIVRFYTVKSPSAARWSGFWALLFISFLYLTAPAMAGFARYYMLESLNGATSEELPAWFQSWEETGLVLWFDDGDGVIRYSNDVSNEIFHKKKLSSGKLAELRTAHEQWVATAGASSEDARVFLNSNGNAGPDRDIVVLATPEMAELSNWIIAFMAAGGLAAALSTASGLLLVISSSVAHDFYFRMVNPQATEKQRLKVGRCVIGVAVIVAGLFGIFPPGFVGQVVAFAFGLAASSFFPLIVLGIFSKRVGTIPAVVGMLTGIAFTASYIIGVVFIGMDKWTLGISEQGISPQGIGAVGMVLNLVVTLALTPFFPPPSKEVQAMIDRVREPEGVSPAPIIEDAPEH